MTNFFLYESQFIGNGVAMDLQGNNSVTAVRTLFEGNQEAIRSRDTDILGALGLPPNAPLDHLLLALQSLHVAPTSDAAADKAIVSQSSFGTWLSNQANAMTVINTIVDWKSKGYIAQAIAAVRAALGI